ncbi:hypothetical protein TIFTF001_026781 [Ficus carica]|uniref:Uncharacterized protein n=1 Tax=Ficus carica TaxID=3494 RepID=A0AA88DLW5_FICCA|nr:hypothetical protein TIFTF001_026781 [Ficus carica]
MISRMQYVVSTRVRSGLVHGLSWTGLAAPTTPWQRTTVSDLPAILDAILWRVGAADWPELRGRQPGLLEYLPQYGSGSGLIQLHCNMPRRGGNGRMALLAC